MCRVYIYTYACLKLQQEKEITLACRYHMPVSPENRYHVASQQSDIYLTEVSRWGPYQDEGKFTSRHWQWLPNYTVRDIHVTLLCLKSHALLSKPAWAESGLNCGHARFRH